MTLSTIQLTQQTKKQLSLRKKPNESYEDVIKRIISQEQSMEEELKKGYLAQYEELKRINEEWSHADSSW